MNSRCNILFLGASEASGYGIQNSFPDLTEVLAREKGLNWKVFNPSRAGASTRDGLGQITRSLHKDLVFHKAFISLGLADAIYAYPVYEIKENLRNMIHELRKHNKDIQIYLTQGEIFQYHAVPGLAPRNSTYYREYTGLFPELARTEGITLVPFIFRDTVGQKELSLADGVHPNQAGARVIANMVFTLLK